MSGEAGDGAEPGEEVDDLPPALSAAREAMETGDLDGAARALEKALADAPADPLAKSWLSQVNLMRRVSSYDPMAVAGKSPRTRKTWPRSSGQPTSTWRAGTQEKAFDRILAVIKRTSGADKNTARLHLLDLFEVLSPDDERLKKARTQLTLLLF